MKKGDTLYCKVDYIFGLKRLNTKNVDYKIVDIFQRFDIKHTQYLVSNDNGDLPCIFYKEEIDKYFYTEKEVRKIKLEKLNDTI
jgi:hypothetical protein